MRANRVTIIIALGAWLAACAGGEHRFPLREPVRHDNDLASVRVRCHDEPTAKDRHHRSCAPATYESPLYWDGADNLVFRPVSEGLGVVTSGESVDVNSLDEVPDSAWFVNRIGSRAMSIAELRQAACSRIPMSRRAGRKIRASSSPGRGWLRAGSACGITAMSSRRRR